MVHRLIRAAEAPVADLRERFNENVLLDVPRETTISVVHYRMTGRTLRIGVEPDRDFPLHVVAMGRCILAHLPERELERYFRGVRFKKLTAKTIDDPDRLRRELARVRADGWAFNEGEFEPEIMAAAASVLFDNRPLAAISVQFPTVRHERGSAGRLSGSELGRRPRGGLVGDGSERLAFPPERPGHEESGDRNN